MKITRLAIRNLLLVTCTSAMLGAAYAKAPDIYRYRGQDAGAYYYYVDGWGCEIRYAFIQFWQEASGSPPKLSGQPAFAFVEVVVSDVCSGTYLYGATSPGGVSLPEGAMQISANSKSASLNATFDLADSDSGSAFTANVSIVWTATGEVQRQTHHDNRKSESEILHVYTRGVGRDSVISGSIVIDGVNISSSVGWGPAWIDQEVEGIITISKLH